MPARDIIAFDRAVTLEDKEVLESTDPDACIDVSRRVEFSMATDRPGLIMRQKLLELLARHGEQEVHGGIPIKAQAPHTSADQPAD